MKKTILLLPFILLLMISCNEKGDTFLLKDNASTSKTIPVLQMDIPWMDPTLSKHNC